MGKKREEMAKKISELLDAAVVKIDAGELEEGENLRKQAEALKGVLDLIPAEPDPKKAKSPAPNPPPYSGGGPPDPESADDHIKAFHVKKFGETTKACEQIARELYGSYIGPDAQKDFAELSWNKAVEFNKFLRYHDYVPTTEMSRLFLLTPDQVMDVAKSGIRLAEVKATMVESNDTLGGFIAPEDFRDSVISHLPAITVVRPRAMVIGASSDRVAFPRAIGGTSRYRNAVRVTWVDETPAAGKSRTGLQWATTGINIHTTMATAMLSRNLAEDAAFDIESYLQTSIAEAVAIDEDERFLVSHGVGNPGGILKNKTTGGPTSSDTIVVKSGDATDITADGVIKMETAIDFQYRQAGAVWVMPKDSVEAVNLLKDSDGRYLFSDNNNQLREGQPRILRRYPLLESEAMPADGTANHYPILYGNFRGYTIADRIGMTIERYLDSTTAEQNLIAYVMRRRVGGDVTEGWRFATMKMAA